MTTALLHPGAMGASLGRALLAARPDEPVLWIGDGRSAQSRARAAEAGLTEVPNLAAAVAEADIVVSVCPPGAALHQAVEVSAAGFDGVYLDANAVSPSTARSIAFHFDEFVDGGIVGPPVEGPGTTRLYVSGDNAAVVADRFGGSDLEVRVIEGGPGAASAVKMGFAAWTKGSSALLLAIRAFAEAEGVADALLGEWATSMPDLAARSERTASTVAPKAWRFEAEMREIADSLAAADLPDGFHLAAAEVYRRMATFKGRPASGADAATLDDVIAVLTSGGSLS